MNITDHLDSLIDWANVYNLDLNGMHFYLSSLIYDEFVKQHTPTENENITYKVEAYKGIPISNSYVKGICIDLLPTYNP